MPFAPSASPDLDPEDWAEFRDLSRQALDGMIDDLQTVRDRPVWQEAPAEARHRFDRPLPHAPQPLDAVLADFDQFIKPYAPGNTHPLFMGWVNGAGTPVGMLADMLAAGLNANCGARNHIGHEVERQITRWSAELLGFPATASGLFVTGTSMANFVALLVARNDRLGDEVRQYGLKDAPQLVAYSSSEAHGCLRKAAEMSGMGARFLRDIAVDAAGAMRLDLLAEAVATDRAMGLTPFLVAGTAGTVNSGAFDDLAGIADFCARENLWFHIDGAFGALAALSPRLKPLVAGIERADSVAFDFHKWLHVPYDAGFLLVRDPHKHRRAFASPAAYLSRAPAGLAAGEVWPCDLGPDLSRGFQALKTWFTFSVFGVDRLGACIDHNCRVAKHLEGRLIERANVFELAAPVALNIVCFGLRGSIDGDAEREVVMDLHARGVAAPSITAINGKTVIRAAIVNHRTTEADIDAFVAALHQSALRVTLRRMHDDGVEPEQAVG